MKIDVHTHILPESWPDLRERYGYGGFLRMERTDACSARLLREDGSLFRALDDASWNPERRIEQCDAAGVEVQVLSTVPVMFSYWAKGPDTLDLSRILNDDLAATVRRRPDRFAGLGTVPLQTPDLAAAETARCVRELGLAGIEIGSHVGERNLGDRELDPFYAAAQEHDAAVFVHPWDMMGTETMAKYWLPWLVGMPAETSRAVCSMIFGGVFDRFPRLRVLFAHGGGAFPFTLGRIEHGHRVRPDLVAVDNPRSPRDYLGRFYLDSLVHDARALAYLVDLFGAERIALGSDYPFPLGEHRPGTLVEESALSPGQKERILRGSALEFLGPGAAARWGRR